MGFISAIKRILTQREQIISIKYVNITPEQIEGMNRAFAMMDDAFKEMDKVFGLTTTPVDGN